MGQNIKSKTRSSKILILSLSLVASVGGWAWLTSTQTQADAPDESFEIAESVEAVLNAAPLQVSAYAAAVVAQPPRPHIPNLAQLPVRGLREVGAYVPPPPQMPTGGQPPSVRQGNQSGGGQAVSQSQPDPQPQPKPKPKRKAKSSK